MILRPVRPQSPTGPPITNLPVGLTRKFSAVNRLASSYSSAGMIGLTTCSHRSLRIVVAESTPSACWVEIRTFSTATGTLSR